MLHTDREAGVAAVIHVAQGSFVHLGFYGLFVCVQVNRRDGRDSGSPGFPGRPDLGLRFVTSRQVLSS